MFEKNFEFKNINEHSGRIVRNQSSESGFVSAMNDSDRAVIFFDGSSALNMGDTVRLRDWLDELIDIACDNGYKLPKEMTLADIEVELGYKIKLVE